MGTTRDEATRHRLLREAAYEFARLGYEAASLRKIAERVGIRAATVYSHFPGGKAQLYEDILGTVSSLLLERIARRYGQNTGLSAEDVIVQVCAAFWDFCEEHPDYASLLLRETFDAESSALLRDGGAAREVVAVSLGYVESAQARGELPTFDVEAFSLWVASYMLGYHGAPGLRSGLQRKPWDARRARDQFVEMVRSLLRGHAMTQVAKA
ncbi:MAG: TetR/AcrR family transcriptional regulator [Polyangiales bacterium]